MKPLHAHAKVNLYLAVGAPESGFHPIRSLFARIGLHDEISIKEEGNGLDLKVSGKYANRLSGRNLLERIWADLKGTERLPRGLKVSLEKKIPVGGGLGGGSSDAAEFLFFLQEHYRVFSSNDELFKYAYEMGKDIPFFLTGWNSAKVEGIQDHLEYFEMDCSQDLFLWVPGEGVSTPDVYDAFDRQKTASVLTTNEKIGKIESNCKDCSFFGQGEVSFNDLSPAFFSLCAQYRRGFEIIRENTYFPLLSGSGSTVFFFLKDKQLFFDMYAEKIGGEIIETRLLGCSQVARQRVLVPPFGGSNPPTPATINI